MAQTKQVGLLQSFKEFDELPLKAGIDQNYLDNVAKGATKIPQKLKAFNAILSSVQRGVNERLSGITSIKNLKFANTFSADSASRSISAKLSYSSTTNGASTIRLNTNVNVNKLLKFPAMEVYSLLSAVVYNSALGGLSKDQIDKIKANDTNELDNNFTLQKVEDVDRQKTAEAQYGVSKFLVSEYLKDLFVHYFPVDFSGDKDPFLNFVADQVSTQLLSDLKPQEIARIPKLFFSFKSLDSKAISSAKEYLPSALYALRTGKLAEQAQANKSSIDYSDAKIVSSQQQAASLIECFSSKNDKVKETLESGFSNDNKKLLGFCQEYADRFLQTNNIPPKTVPIRFGGNGCEYHDEGPYIEINLNDPMFRGENISELMSSLSHELTHAVESYINKQNGKRDQYGGGLVGNLGDDVSTNNNLPDNVKDLLVRMQATCYIVNPVERNARIGELSGILFMKDLYAGDAKMNAQIDSSIKAFIAYQQNTINTLKGVQAIFEAYKSEADALNLPTNSAEYNMIKTRLDYLQNADLDVSREEESIKDAQDILNGKQNKNKEEEQSKETQENAENAEKQENAEREM